jgi:hypothetical protein
MNGLRWDFYSRWKGVRIIITIVCHVSNYLLSRIDSDKAGAKNCFTPIREADLRGVTSLSTVRLTPPVGILSIKAILIR